MTNTILSQRNIDHIKQDCLYSRVYDRYKGSDKLEEALRKSGYIEEPRSEMDALALSDMRFLTMPIRQAGSVFNDGPHAVLVSTGSYSPVHAGHIDIMNKARDYVEGLGYRVIQGVMSASHDAYVSIKNGGAARMHVGSRSQKIYEAIQGSDWLSFDRFEGEGVSCAINFSTVLGRVRNYVLTHNTLARRDVTVFYVFGSDNVGFADAFVGNEHFHGICVDRGGYDIRAERDRYRDEQSVHFLDSNDETAWISSTKVRAETAVERQAPTVDDVYLIRTDQVPDSFANSLGDTISRHTEQGMSFRYISSADFELERVGTISLDKFVPGEYSIDASRVFETASGQISAQYMTSLVGSIESQAERIPAGAYTLVDDDSVSGYTMNKIEEMLSLGGVTVNARRTLISQVLKPSDRLYDIVDARDFLIGAKKGGLVVDLFGEHVRAPYLFPFVNLVTRARIRPESQLRFSREIWALNKAYQQGVKISDLEDSQRLLYEYLGFTGEVDEVCDHFIALIDNYLSSEQ